MENLLDSTENQDIIFVNDVKELKNFKGLVNKRLCIIKTDFKDINKIKSFCKNILNSRSGSLVKKFPEKIYYLQIPAV